MCVVVCMWNNIMVNKIKVFGYDVIKYFMNEIGYCPFVPFYENKLIQIFVLFSLMNDRTIVHTILCLAMLY